MELWVSMLSWDDWLLRDCWIPAPMFVLALYRLWACAARYCTFDLRCAAEGARLA